MTVSATEPVVAELVQEVAPAGQPWSAPVKITLA